MNRPTLKLRFAGDVAAPERVFGSREFIQRTRNPDLALRPPARFEPTPKNDGDIVL